MCAHTPAFLSIFYIHVKKELWRENNKKNNTKFLSLSPTYSSKKVERVRLLFCFKPGWRTFGLNICQCIPGFIFYVIVRLRPTSYSPAHSIEKFSGMNEALNEKLYSGFSTELYRWELEKFSYCVKEWKWYREATISILLKYVSVPNFHVI